MKDEYSLEKLERVREFERIKAKYKQKRYKEAKAELASFILKYPEDDFGWYYYGKVLMHEGKCDEALNMFMDRNAEHNMMMQIDIIKCYLELCRYEEAYELICKIKDIVKNDFAKLFLRRAEIFSLKGMNEIGRLSFKNLGYTEKQMISYDRKEALIYTKALNENSHLFAGEISIEKLFDEVEDVLLDVVNLTNNATLTDTYLLRIPGIGYDSGRRIDVLKATTIYNTQDILSIYPATSIKDYPSYMISNQEQIKIKVLKGEK